MASLLETNSVGHLYPSIIVATPRSPLLVAIDVVSWYAGHADYAARRNVMLGAKGANASRSDTTFSAAASLADVGVKLMLAALALSDTLEVVVVVVSDVLLGVVGTPLGVVVVEMVLLVVVDGTGVGDFPIVESV